MKILFFTNEYSHPNLPSSGGVGSFLKILGRELSIQGHEVHIYGFSKKKHSFSDGKVNVKLFKKYAKQFPFSEFLRSLSGTLKIKSATLFFLQKERKYLAIQLKKYVEANNIHIIESSVFGGYTSYWDNSIPLVLRFHGSRGFWHYYLGQKKETNLIYLEQIALEGTPNVVAVSKFSAFAVEEIYKLKTDKIIYNGIDSILFSPKVGIKEIEQSIFYFGTVSKAKGLDTLCHVFNDIIKKYPKASLHIIGRGKDYWENDCTPILSKTALNQTVYYGTKLVQEIPNLIRKASVCVFPSLNENFSLAIQEAMALEKVVVASDIPSFNEIIEHSQNGFIAKSQEDFVKYISKMFSYPKDKIQIGKNARIHINKHFTIEIMTKNTIDYYQSILNKK